MLPPRDPPQIESYTQMKGWKEIFHANGNENIARVAILISEKIL